MPTRISSAALPRARSPRRVGRTLLAILGSKVLIWRARRAQSRAQRHHRLEMRAYAEAAALAERALRAFEPCAVAESGSTTTARLP